MRKKRLTWLSILALPLAACIFFSLRYPTDADTIKVFIHSGTNIFELLKTFDHYRDDPDQRKYTAAHFLIRNMDLHYFREDSLANLKLHWASQHPDLKHQEILDLEDSLDILWTAIPARFPTRKIRDCREVTAEFLVNHTDQAFDVWDHSPWNDRFNFEEFCEFFLPYKTNLSRPELWMYYYKDQYGWVVDSLAPDPDILSIIKLVFRKIDPKLRWVTMDMGRIAGAVELDTALVGDCQIWADWWSLILRSMGVPVAKTQNPNFGNAAGGHFGVVFKDEDGRWIEFERARENRWIYSAWEQTAAKIWMDTWGKQKTTFRAVAHDHGLKLIDIPPLLRRWNIRDISSQLIHTTDVEVQLKRKPPGNAEFVYLALFDNHNWHPIHWAIKEENQALFDQMGNDVLYLPVYYKDGKSLPAAEPFILTYDGEKQTIHPDTNCLIDIDVDRVYPVRNSEMKGYCDLLYEGTFEASNDASFAIYEILYHIDQMPGCIPPFNQKMKGKLAFEMWWQDMAVKATNAYRYLRFRADPEKICAIGEIEVFGRENEKISIVHAYGSGSNPAYVSPTDLQYCIPIGYWLLPQVLPVAGLFFQ